MKTGPTAGPVALEYVMISRSTYLTSCPRTSPLGLAAVSRLM